MSALHHDEHVRSLSAESRCSPKNSPRGGAFVAQVCSALLVSYLWMMSCQAEDDDRSVYRCGAVAADHPLASEAGVEMLRRGGNVIDAAIATAATLSVVRPASSGLGGGGFLLYYDAREQRVWAYDYRERAPLAATVDMFSTNADPQASRIGGLAVAVPGAITGWYDIHQQHGKLPWAEVLEPALRLAQQGVPLDPHERQIQHEMLRRFERHPDHSSRFATLWQQYLQAGRPWDDSTRFNSPQRAALELLRREGRTALTHGALGQSLVDTVRSAGGILTAEDWSHASPVLRAPLRISFRDYEIVTMPLPSSGGIVMALTLQTLEAWSSLPGNPAWDQLPLTDRLHLLAEAMKYAYALRAATLGDADAVPVRVAELLDGRLPSRWAQHLDLHHVHPPEHYGRFITPDDHGTTHFCVMDAQGNAVACTETINTTFGSLVVDPRFGIILNNEMDDFTTQPGQANAFGLRQSDANRIAPRKKPLSSMTPTLVFHQGQPVLIVGGSGGPRIISATLQVLLTVVLHHEKISSAVALPRIHHQWQPDTLFVEANFADALLQSWEKRGHSLRSTRGNAVVQGLQKLPDGLLPACDPRKHGRPAGW
ncbi:MAG: gamma-glutamyltransferase [Planctomycetaceae bacterium]|nr:MAG: gamma-glutamyltransferase [Planctomycetaceae bacterium]